MATTTKEEKRYSAKEVKVLIENAYKMGINYAYFCMTAKPTDAEMSKAKQFSLNRLLNIPEKPIKK